MGTVFPDRQLFPDDELVLLVAFKEKLQLADAALSRAPWCWAPCGQRGLLQVMVCHHVLRSRSGHA